jgi:transcription-repair coupling factor (superfamily II helicase)
MNSLSFTELIRKTASSKPVSLLSSAIYDRNFPIEIEGSEGAFSAILIALGYSQIGGQFLIVVPQESDADDLILDLSGTGFPCLKFNWWGTAPYRGLGAFSPIFGERVKCLTDITLGKPSIIIVPQRALLTPLPPPEYIKNLLVNLTLGEEIDTSALVKLLVSYGYTRVPRVQVHGEFALRGEVLDIFMSADDEPYRVLFDFATIESIKRFDPLLQNTGSEKFDQLIIRPIKEVIWTDDRIEELEKNLTSLKEFSDKGNAVIDELITCRTLQGEEIFYPLAFAKTSNLLDYIDEKSILFLLEKERLENMQESLEREYQGLYMRAKRENK